MPGDGRREPGAAASRRGAREGGPDPPNASQSETSNYHLIVICDYVDSIRHTRTYSARRYKPIDVDVPLTGPLSVQSHVVHDRTRTGAARHPHPATESGTAATCSLACSNSARPREPNRV